MAADSAASSAGLPDAANIAEGDKNKTTASSALATAW
jgi:hypothetical protein